MVMASGFFYLLVKKILRPIYLSELEISRLLFLFTSWVDWLVPYVYADAYFSSFLP
jgi:hypothetical protein